MGVGGFQAHDLFFSNSIMNILVKIQVCQSLVGSSLQCVVIFFSPYNARVGH